MILRKFNASGIQQFSDFLIELGEDPTRPVPESLLTDNQLTTEVQPEINICKRQFANRLDCAQYLHETLVSAETAELRDAGLWAWLSLFYFDEVCPSRNGSRFPHAKARHIPQMTNFQRFYRHLLLNPFMIYDAHFGHLHEVMAVLASAVDSPGDVPEQFASRQELITNRGVLGLATTLYYDPKKKRLKTGAGGKSNGSPRRLAKFLNQIDLTYDLYEMKSIDFGSILPREFDRFK